MTRHLRERDKEILDALQRFRVAERDDIKNLFFAELEVPLVACNRVLLKLKNKGLLIADDQGLNEQFLYHPNPRRITRRSKKLNHYLGILRTYIQLNHHLPNDIYQKDFFVEPRYTDVDPEYPQPDAVFSIHGLMFFLEYQVQNYSKETINQKMKRYERMSYDQGLIETKFNGRFPKVWLLSKDRSYKHKLQNQYRFVVETRTAEEFVEYLLPHLFETLIMQS